MMKPTVILGASDNPSRYSYMATERLMQCGYRVFPIGIKKGNIQGVSIINDKPELKDIDTITIYLSVAKQKNWYPYIFQLNPKRIIFNPGAENKELEEMAIAKGIDCMNACTLVMIAVGNY
jgi:predicted CoA-binding protein